MAELVEALASHYPNVCSAYVSTIAELPQEVWPATRGTGQYNYTIMWGGAKVEVQLKNRCFYMKAMADGTGKPKCSPTVKWNKFEDIESCLRYVKAALKISE